MSQRGGRSDTPRQPTLPPVSSRTLHHPSLMPLYMAAGFGHHHRNCHSQTVHPIIPAEFFYSDPTMGSGNRIPNIVTDLRVLDCFQLNTPPPVMTVSPAPPNRPDPFRSRPHPTRNLGSPTWRMPTNQYQMQPSQAVVQLTQEEDEAITNLLKLHHQSPLLSAAQMDFSSVAVPTLDLNSSLFHQRPADSSTAGKIHEPSSCDVQHPQKVQKKEGWSDIELEAANTLLNRFVLSEEDRIWGSTFHKSVKLHLELMPYQHPGDLSVNIDTQHRSEAHSKKNDSNYSSFSCVSENEDLSSAEDGRVSGDVSAALRGQTLSDSEGDAVHGLLSLSDMGPVNIV